MSHPGTRPTPFADRAQAFLSAADLADPECPDCEGAGVVEVDTIDRRGQHVSRREPCRCAELGERPDWFDEYATDEEIVGEVAWEQVA